MNGQFLDLFVGHDPSAMFYFPSDYLTTIADETGGKRSVFGYPTNTKLGNDRARVLPYMTS